MNKYKERGQKGYEKHFLATTRNWFGVFEYGKMLFLLLLISACFASSLPADTIAQASSPAFMMTSGDACPTRKEIISKTRTLRVPFIANNGQVDEQVKFYAKTFGGTVFVTKEGEIVYALPGSEKAEDGRQNAKCGVPNAERVEPVCVQTRTGNQGENPQIGFNDLNRWNGLFGCSLFNTCSSYLNSLNTSNSLTPSKTVDRSVALKETIVGAKIGGVTGEQPAVTTVNYFTGNDKSKWKTNVPAYTMVNLGEVYKGIELRIKAYGGNVEKLFCVKPGTDPEQIKIRLCGIQPPESPLEKGARGLSVNEHGELEVETELGLVKFTRPIAYQEIEGKRVYVDCGYLIADCGLKKSEMQNLNSEVQNPNTASRPLPMTRQKTSSSTPCWHLRIWAGLVMIGVFLSSLTQAETYM